ncbi:hypothetical protein EXN67_24705 [Rhizobium rhizogenes]|nr:hypothetical protein EXN67_24705 [Rhizobium rhizogenes]TRB39753.1 hypothetical protein EXN73_24265 [Rhizobium rhizogenes]TRB54936.1 hypothetical protein EXN71_24220 [Rhizobium rhizogenes]
MPSPDSIHDQSASSVVESGRTEKSKLARVDSNPQRSDVAHPNYNNVPVPFGLSVRFRTALVLTPIFSMIYKLQERRNETPMICHPGFLR